MHSTTILFLSIASSILPTVVAKPLRSLDCRKTVAIPGYDYAGCYTEVAERALSEKVTYDDAMTLELCAASCEGFTWWGVEYGRECYCGNTLATGSVSVPAASCSFACPGNAAESCGAGNYLTMYAKTGTVTPGSGTPSTYGSLGCYTEARTERALIDVTITNDQMTVESCAASCAGYSYFGLEFASECYCGNTLQAGSTKTLDSACQYTCSGNSQESCGGDRHLNLYQFGATDIGPDAPVTTFNRQGCYAETYPTRALSEKDYFDDEMTVEKCGKACAGYAYFGLEYGRECYCGNTILASSTTTGIDDSECNFPCPGDSSEFCGAGNRVDMYKFGPKTPVSSSSSASLTSTTPVSSSSSAIPTSSADVTTISSPSTTSSSSSSIDSTSSGSSIPTSTSSSSINSSSATTSSSIESTSSSTSAPVSTSSSSSSSSSSFITSSSSLSSTSTFTTSTSTSTSSTPNPTPTTLLLIANGSRANRVLSVVNQYIQYNYTASVVGVPISVILAGGQPYLPATPAVKLFVHSTSTVFGALYFETAVEAATRNEPSVTCKVSSAGIMTCLSSNGFDTLWSCGAYLYMGKTTWSQSGCEAVTFKLATTT